MIKVDIPGRGKYEIENAVFDYNGTAWKWKYKRIKYKI